MRLARDRPFHVAISWRYAGKLGLNRVPMTQAGLVLSAVCEPASEEAQVLAAVDRAMLGRTARDIARFRLRVFPAVASPLPSTHLSLLTLHATGAFLIEFTTIIKVTVGDLGECISYSALGRRTPITLPAGAESPTATALGVANQIERAFNPWRTQDSRPFDGALERLSSAIVSADRVLMKWLLDNRRAALAAAADMDPYFETRANDATEELYRENYTIDTGVNVWLRGSSVLCTVEDHELAGWTEHLVKVSGMPVPDATLVPRYVSAHYIAFLEWALLEVATAEHFLRWYEETGSRTSSGKSGIMRSEVLDSTLTLRDFPKDMPHGVRLFNKVRDNWSLEETYARIDRRKEAIESVASVRAQARQDLAAQIIGILALSIVGDALATALLSHWNWNPESDKWMAGRIIGLSVGPVLAMFFVLPSILGYLGRSARTVSRLFRSKISIWRNKRKSA
jgi:hypothetical protein